MATVAMYHPSDELTNHVQKKILTKHLTPYVLRSLIKMFEIVITIATINI